MKRTACALAAWAVLIFVAGEARGDPSASCAAERAGDRAEAKVVLSELFDGELLHLVRLGLRGQIRLEVTLYRRRRFWFDERRALEVRDVVVTWSRDEGHYLLDGRAIDDPVSLTIVPVALRSMGQGDHYLEVRARLEVVTVKSLGQMATWLVQGNDDEPSPLGKGLVSYVAAGLVRTASARCRVN
ncbi:MAG TPA: hypothetical protein VN914_02055 [Polyangia bacterium]|nr:hypothetical protein [Polyangia bacterium]